MASTLPQLLKAIQAGSVADVKRILTYNPSLAHQKQARDGGSPLHVAAATGNLAIVRELLQAGSTVQETDSNLEVPLHIACRQRNGASVVKELLSDAGRRSCLKALNRDGATPLHLAVQAGLLDIARLLVNAGAKVDATDRTGRTPADYVDPRLPGLSELLEAGRQLTPSRAPSGATARTNLTHGTGSKHRASPFQSPSSGNHPSGHHPATIGAFRAAAGSPGPGGARSRGGSGVVSPAGGQGGHKQQQQQQQYGTPQRRSSSAYSSWDTSPSQAPYGTKLAFHTPVQHKPHEAGSAAAAAGGVAAESSIASLASPKPPRPDKPPAAATVAAAVAAMQLQQQQAAVVSPRRESSDWSSFGGVVEGGDNPASAVTQQQQQQQHEPSVICAAFAASADTTAAEQQQQEDREEGAQGGLSPDLAAAAFIAAQKKQQQQLLAAAAAAAAGEVTTTAAAGEDSTELKLHYQQQQQGVRGSTTRLPPPQQQSNPLPLGPLQQQVPTALPHAPATYAHAAPSSAAAGQSAAGFGSYCRGPLSLAQPQMQAVGSAAGFSSSSTNVHEHPGAGTCSSSMPPGQHHHQGVALLPAAGNNAAAAAVHYHQQLAAATAACQQSLQQLHGNLTHLSGQKSSTSIEPHAAALPMGPLRSGRVAAAAAAAGAAATDPARASYDPQAAAVAARRPGANAANPTNASVDAAAARRRSSSNNGMLVGNSWIVTPEASSGLLGGPLAGSSSAASHSGLTAAAGGAVSAASEVVAGSSSAAAGGEAAGQAVELQAAGPSGDPCTGPQQQQATEATAVATARPAQKPAAAMPQHAPAGVTYVTPSAAAAAGVTAAAAGGAMGDRGQHPALAAAQQLHKQQQQLAGIAAAVAAGGYGGSSGPLQAPLLAQLGELAGKVSRLEDFVEAQVELIPDWQKALEVVTAVKRQSDDHGHLLTEQEARLATQVDFVMDLAGRVDGLSGWTQQAQQSFDKADTHFEQLEAGQSGLREYLDGLEAQLQQLQGQLAEQEAAAGVRAVTAEGQVSSLVSQLDDTNSRLDATASRLSNVEAAAAEAQQQLQEQQQAVAAATALAAAAAEAAAAGCAAGDGSGSSRSRSSLVAHRASAGSTAQQALLAESLTKQLAELKLQFGELSATVSGMSRASRVAAAFSRRRQGSGSSQGRAESVRSEREDATAGALILRRASVDMAAEGDQHHHGWGGVEGGQVPSEVGEAWLPFMESTSACLAAHEQQIEALQSLVPKLDGVVSQRAQLINMAEQLAALQTAFNMMHHNTSRSGSQSGGVCPQGPLGTHKAAVDSLSLATSMVRLQGQMGQLTLAVEALREEWEDATEAIKGEREAIRRDWEAERARIASAEAEVARLLAEQQADFADREERLIQIRAAAAEADDAARVAALESQQQVSAQLASLQAHQALMAQQLAAAHAANDTLRTELMAVQSQLAATAEAQAAMAEAQATATAAMAAAANATMRRSIQSISEDGNAAAAATAGDLAAARRQRSRVQSPAEAMMAAAATAAAAGGSAGNWAAGGACEYPHVFEAASPTENPFLADPSPAAAAAAALAAAAAATAATGPASLSAEPSVELAVLGERRLVSGSVFGPSYWAGLDQARRASSGSGGSHSPRASRLVSPSAATAGVSARSAAAAGDGHLMEHELHPEASVLQQQQHHQQEQQQRRMTYDAVVPSGTGDRGRVRAERSAAAVESYLAGASAVTAPGASTGVRSQHQEGVTDTYTVGMLAQGSHATSPTGPWVGGDEGTGRKKLGWFARVRLGHSSSGGGSRVKAAAATIDAAAGAPPAAVPVVEDGGDSKRARKARAAAAAKAQKQQQLLLKSVTAGGSTGACDAGGNSSSMQPVKRSAAGVLFGRWSKQARKSKADPATAAPYADDWPSVPGPLQGNLRPATASPPAAYTAGRGSSPALGDAQQYGRRPTGGGGASSRGQSSGGDVRGTNSDQTFGPFSAAAEAGGAWAAAGYSGAAGQAGVGVGEEGVKPAGGKWRRRLLGARGGAQQV